MQRLLCISSVALLLSVALCTAACSDETGAVETRLFHARADHPWNRLHAALWLREAADGMVYGRDRLDPLLWKDTQRLTKGDSAKQALKRLDQFLALRDPELENEALKRAVLQRDLWAVFDWLANREHAADMSSDDRALRRQLRQKLAAAMQRLALDRKQIAKLPDNYTAAVTSKEFLTAFDPKRPQRPFLPPRLFDREGPWVGLGTADGPIAPAHVRGDAGFSRSAFTVFLRLPGGRQKTLDYLKRLEEFKTPWVKDPKHPRLMIPNPETPQFSPGTQVALVRRMLLIDSQGQLTPTALTEQMQIRVYRRLEDMSPLRQKRTDPPQLFFEFVLSRERLFAGHSGGLRAVSPDERDFTPTPFSVGIDVMELATNSPKATTRPLSRHMSVTLETCVACHRQAGVLSFNTYTRSFGPRTVRPPSFFETGTERADQMGVFTKKRRYDWGLLSGLWSRNEPTAES